MAPFEIPGLLIAIVIFSVVFYLMGQRNLPSGQGTILGMAILVRIFAVLIYSYVVFAIYGGAADPVIYFRWGQRFSEYFRNFDLSPFFDSELWRGPAFTGTNFVGYPSAFLILLVGESFRGTWLLYSGLCLSALLLFSKVFFRAYGRIEYKNYLHWVLFYPSLWFWTANVSKDTWMLFGVAIFLTGMLTQRKKQSISIMALGLFWCYLVRPQVAAILAFALAGSYFLVSFDKFSFRNIAILVIAMAGAVYFLSVIGITDFSEVVGYAEGQRAKSSYGGSEIQLSSGIAAYFLGPMNILFRPFPWEIGGLLQIISFLDIYILWGLALYNRKSVFRAFQMIRKDRLIAFSVIFILLFSLGAGLALSNLGLIARQRIILYPFVFLIIFAYSDNRMVFLRRKQQKERENRLLEIARLQNA